MPFEMITMLGSTVLGGVMSIWSQSIKAKQEEQKMLIQRAEVQQKSFKEAREYDNKGFQWTRRIIALTAVFAIVLLPKLLADKPLAKFAENIVAPVFARNEILLSESVLIDDTTI